MSRRDDLIKPTEAAVDAFMRQRETATVDLHSADEKPPMSDGVDRDGLMEITVVVNGPLEISEGKIIGQAFQGAARMMQSAAHDSELRALTDEWLHQGTRTIVRSAKTPAMFERVCAEIPGQVMRDEGFTEVEPDTATLFVSTPYRHVDRPRLLDNKKVPLLAVGK